MTSTLFLKRKKRYWGIVALFILVVLVLRYGFIEYSLLGRLGQIYYSHVLSNHHDWNEDLVLPKQRSSANGSRVLPSFASISDITKRTRFSAGELHSLMSWDYMNGTVGLVVESLPHAVEAVLEGREAWERLMDSVEEGRRQGSVNVSNGNQCPYSIKRMESSDIKEKPFRMSIPCGLVQGSSITFIGTPSGLLSEFRIDLIGSKFPGEPEPPIILHYSVRTHGDRITEDPVIVQNTWTAVDDWGLEQRCPSPDFDNTRRVDDLEQCNAMVGRNLNQRSRTRVKEPGIQSFFPFRKGYLAIATIRVGMEGIQMVVDGKHITSFAFRDRLEPWLVSEVQISGDIKLISVVANGLPTFMDSDNVVDLEALKAPHLPTHKPLHLFIGIFSSANNFRRRMAIRRTWLQYPEVRSGAVAARFFVGLHINQMVNEELWYEAQTYGDVQLVPFVDYYTLITWKTIAICVYSANAFSAKYVMKTDDDSFVRVDEILFSLKSKNVTHGLLFGQITFDDQPQRSPDSKWYISPEEWPYDTYPPWAHGPGYIVSHDIAKNISKMQKNGTLWMFKLEDVGMGIWIAQMRKNGMKISYEHEKRIHTEGCQQDYIVAHYQGPREILCLWSNIMEIHEPSCCGAR